MKIYYSEYYQDYVFKIANHKPQDCFWIFKYGQWLPVYVVDPISFITETE